MSKAAVQDILDVGFQASQFNTPNDWSTTATGYIARVLNRMALVVADIVGEPLYTDAADLTLERIKQAEVEFVTAELWRRIEQFERSQVNIGGGDSGAETIGSRALNNADEAEARAWLVLGKITGENYSGVGGASFGYVQSGAFESEATAS